MKRRARSQDVCPSHHSLPAGSPAAAGRAPSRRRRSAVPGDGCARQARARPAPPAGHRVGSCGSGGSLTTSRPPPPQEGRGAPRRSPAAGRSCGPPPHRGSPARHRVVAEHLGPRRDDLDPRVRAQPAGPPAAASRCGSTLASSRVSSRAGTDDRQHEPGDPPARAEVHDVTAAASSTRPTGVVGRTPAASASEPCSGSWSSPEDQPPLATLRRAPPASAPERLPRVDLGRTGCRASGRSGSGARGRSTRSAGSAPPRPGTITTRR